MGPLEITAYDHLSPEEKILKLNQLIDEWREPELSLILPHNVIPDTTNRTHTGLSGNHVHYIADRMQRFGFQPRNLVTGQGHDLPIVIRETLDSPFGKESLTKWQSTLKKKSDLPRTKLGLEGQPSFFCSLGNGHFFQALNLFGTTHACKFPEITGQKRYWTVFDAKLREAVQERGVPCLVLKTGMSKMDRKFISIMLNSTFEFEWKLDNPFDGSSKVSVDSTKQFRQFETFDGLTKHADAFELDEIIQVKMQFEKRDRLLLEHNRSSL